jgi:ABC-2 type transport system ATP-binding protein
VRVELDNIGKTYDGHAWAVREFSLDIPEASVFGFIGPNGAGKSTTLRMIATVMAPTEGVIRLDGTPVLGDPTELRQRIGFLGDGNPLYKHMTAAEYLRFFGQCFGMRGSKLEASITHTLDELALTHKADTRCGELSKGMRQRVLIGRCLLHSPDLLILDEPADGLDPRGRNELRRTLQRIRHRGVTIVVSSHILRELDDLCDQVAIVQRGRLVVSGPVDQLVESHEVARFVYEIRMLDAEGDRPGVDDARRVLLQHSALIEGQGEEDGLPVLRVQVRGGEALMAEILAALVQAGVRVVTVSRQRSRLEDVYDKLSEDQVN